MIVRDWSTLSAAEIAPVYAAERTRWLQNLQWDSSAAWQEVEHARVTWGLPGFVAADHMGCLHGAAFYLPEDDRIDIGGISSSHVLATDVLLDAVIRVAESSGVQTVRILALDAAVALSSGLRVRGFEVEPHLYLSRSLSAPPPAPPRAGLLWKRAAERTLAGHPVLTSVETWHADDVEAAASLLARAYDRQTGRLFAPRHEAGEWQRYVRNLVTHVGCGTVNPAHSLVVRDGGELRAVALVTDIAPGAAHLVQLAVDPSLRGSKVGAALVHRVCATLQQADYRALTLMVAGTNAAARALYDHAGFRHDATFLSGTLSLADRKHAAA